MSRIRNQKAAPIRPQWKGTEEAETMTAAEFERIMHPFVTGERDLLDCEVEPPRVVRAKVR